MIMSVTTLIVNELMSCLLASKLLAAFKTTSINRVKKLQEIIIGEQHGFCVFKTYCDFSLASSSGLRQCVNIGTTSSSSSLITTEPAPASRQLNSIQSAECELQLV